MFVAALKRIETSITKGFVQKSNTNLTSLMVMHVWLRLPLTCATVQMRWVASHFRHLPISWHLCRASRLIWCLTAVLHLGCFLLLCLFCCRFLIQLDENKNRRKVSWQTKETERGKNAMSWMDDLLRKASHIRNRCWLVVEFYWNGNICGVCLCILDFCF